MRAGAREGPSRARALVLPDAYRGCSQIGPMWSTASHASGRAAIDVVTRKVFGVAAELLCDVSNREGWDIASVLGEWPLELQEL